ncbi:MAG TPA: DnaJ domain-containing protein [Candidatus Binataceae bacterium]
MPKRDLYSILGVPVDAGAETIKNAYRRLAMRLHPDAGREPDPARFRDVHQAYTVLSDAARRRAHDVEIGRVSRTSAPIEEIRAGGGPIGIPDDFETVAPSLGEILDHIAQNFFGFHQKSGGLHRRLGLEIVLSREEALTGGRLPFEVPCYERCPRFHAGAWMWGLCPLCHGYGLVEGGRQVAIDIAPGIRNGSRYEVALDRAGISNLTLDVTVLVA